MVRTRKVRRVSPSRTTRKRRKTTTTRRKKSTMKFEVKSSVMREIWAVIYFSVAAVTFLSIQGAFGIVGDLWVDGLKPILGWGHYMIPPMLLLISLMLFFARKVNFGLAKIVGTIMMLVSILSIIHLSVPIEDLHEVAKAGTYGGYVGFVTNFLLRTSLNIGTVGAATIFLTTAMISILLTFEVSIAEIARLLKPEIKIEKRPAKKKDKKEEDLPNLNNTMPDQEIEAGGIHLASDEMLKAIYGNAENVKIKRATSLNGEKGEGAVVEAALETNGKPEIKKTAVSGRGSGMNLKANAKTEENDFDPEKDYTDEEPDYSQWEFPSLDLLDGGVSKIKADDNVLKEKAEKIRSKLEQFGIAVEMRDVHVGPTVVQYTLKPHEGVKLSKITTLKNDLALALAAPSVRIEAPIPGKALVGIEVPTEERSIVHLREVLESEEFKKGNSALKFPLGRDVSGTPIIADLKGMPHLLIAGSTGSGKSVGMNTFLISLLYQNSPQDLRLILIDPKRVELRDYNGIPHLLTPVITDPEKASTSLRWCVAEMNRRYKLLADNKKRNITDLNEDPLVEDKLTVIVVVIDELADLMMAAGKDVEASICRIAQMSRAVGIHLVIATQRPSVDVITGLIKANIPSRIAFAVSSSIDSRTILDATGAEDLLGKGDMLYLPSGMNKPIRIQGIYTSSSEIERVTNRVKLTYSPDYDEDIISTRSAGANVQGIPATKNGNAEDALYEAAVTVIKENRKASASLLQRRLKVGYARAARILDLLEENGMIGPSNGAKPREIFIDNN
jgi:DNA segregation ATPase FtsK/SpoIIIE, S-DNA-T family